MRIKKLILSAIVFGIAFLLHVIVLLDLPISKLGTLFSLPVSALLLCALPSALIASLVLLIDKSSNLPIPENNITEDEEANPVEEFLEDLESSPIYANLACNIYHDHDFFRHDD